MKSFLKTCVVAIITYEAKLLLRRAKPTIIGVTGNVGKTTTKDAIYAVLKQHMHTRKSEKSFNSDIGVPLSVLGLQNGWNSPVKWLRNILDGGLAVLAAKHYPKVLVLEMGVDRPGDMKKLGAWVKPDIVVLTRFPDVPVHVEYFGSPEAVIAEKMELVKALRPEGKVIYNHDDERITKALEEVRQEAIGYGRYAPTDVMAKDDEVHYQYGQPTGIKFLLESRGESALVHLPGVLGVPQLYTASAAAAVGLEFGVSLESAAEAMSGVQQSRGRLRLLPGKNDTVLIDDTYNASPLATEHALITLKELASDGKKVAVIGDMLELGKYSTDAHRSVGAAVPEAADVLVTIGVRAREVAQAALEQGMSEKFIYQYDTAERAASEIESVVKAGDLVLIKGSQGVRAEKVTKALLRDQAKASEYLVRQEKVWQER